MNVLFFYHSTFSSMSGPIFFALLKIILIALFLMFFSSLIKNSGLGDSCLNLLGGLDVGSGLKPRIFSGKCCLGGD